MIIGSAEVELRPDTNKFANDARKQLKGIGGDLGEAGVGLAGLTGKISAIGPAIAAATAAAAAAASGLVAVIGATGPAFVAAGAAGAGTYAAIAQGAGVATFALAGIDKALTGNQKAIDALTPRARRFVTALNDTKPAIESVRKSAQAGLFPGLATAITTLSDRYLPILRRSARETGDALGDVAAQGATLAASGPFRRDFAQITSANAGFLRNFGGAGIALIDAFRTLYVVSLPLIRVFSEFTLHAANAVNSAVQAGRETGKLQQFFARATSAAQQLGGIMADLGSAIFNVFRQGADVSGQGFLDSLERGAAAAKAWTESVGGQQSIRQFFVDGKANLEAMGRLASGLIGIFHTLSGAGTPLAPLIDKVSANLLPALGRLVENASASKALDALVLALTDVINTLADMEAADSSLKAFAETLGALARGADFVLQNVPGATKALGAFFVVAGSAKALSLVGLGGVLKAAAAAAVGYSATIIASLLGITVAQNATTASVIGAIAKDLAARAVWVVSNIGFLTAYAASNIAAAASSAAAWVASTATQVAALAVRSAALIAGAAVAIASFIATAAAATAAGIATAAAFLLPLLPIALLIAAVVGIVILIVKNWDTIKAATEATFRAIGHAIAVAFDAVKSAVSGAINFVVGFIKSHWVAIVSLLTGPIGAAVIQVVRHWDDIKSAFSRGIAAVVNFVKGFGARITSAFGDLGSLLAGVGRDVVLGLVHGIENAADLVIGAAKSLASHIPKWVKKVLGITSPSKVLQALGEETGRGFALGLSRSTEQEISAALDKLTQKVKDNAKALGQHTVAGVLAAVRSGRGTLLAYASEVQQTFDAFKQIAATTAGAGNLSSLGADASTGIITGASLVSALQARVDTAKRFAAELTTLVNRGLNQQALADLASAGAQQGEAAARAIVDAGDAIIPTLNSLQAQITHAAIDVAQTGSTAMFTAGQDSARGFAKGFREQQKLIEDEMLRVAQIMRRAIRKALGIHSPSTVFAEVARDGARGLLLGFDQMQDTLDRRVARLVAPDLAALVAASQSSTAVAAGAGAGSARLNIEQVTLPPATTPNAGQQLADGVRLLDALYG